MDILDFTAFNFVYDNWFKENDFQRFLIRREIIRQRFNIECLLGVDHSHGNKAR